MKKVDLLLIHPPAFFDFRDQIDNIYWPFFSSGGSEPITPLYENIPIGFLSLKNILSEKDFSVEIINMSSLILLNPSINLEDYFKQFEAKLIGISLHWMVHVHGAVKMSNFFKSLYKDTPIVFGGISSTYYADELIQKDTIDMVMRGYDTHSPMLALMNCLTKGRDYDTVENLLWKNDKNKVFDNGFNHLPSSSSCGVNFEYIPKGKRGILDFKDILSVENFGCAHNCGWCGGSRDAFKRINGVKKGLVTKELDAIDYELKSLERAVLDGKKVYNLYSLGAYSESSSRMDKILETVSKYPIKNIMIDQFHLTSDDLLKRMAATDVNITINLSPQSHNLEVSKLSGRGTYDMDEMEDWIIKALALGIYSVDVYFFVGMPKQDIKSVKDTIQYCKKLLIKFKGTNVNAFICPMMPFLDPGSNYFENPDKYGYKVFCKTLDEHLKAMEEPSLIGRLNYETKWLTKEEIVTVSYEAIIELFLVKKEIGMLSSNIVDPMVSKLSIALEMIKKVHDLKDTDAFDQLRDSIQELNIELFFGNNMKPTVLNQAFPINRKIGRRWFDIIPD